MALRRLFLPRLEYILFAAIFWGVAVSGPRLLNFDGDLPRHLLHGMLILQTGEVATTDIFSFRTAGYPSYPHEWLSQVTFALAYRWLGLSGVVLVAALVIALTASVIYQRAMRQSNSLFMALFFTGLAVAAGQIHLLPRPHLFSYLLTAIWMVLLNDVRNNQTRARWLLPLAMLLWVNLHGMFVLGIMIWGIYLAGDFLDHPSTPWFRNSAARALLLGGAWSLAATFVSPSGFHIWTAITSLASNSYITSRIPEYQSANFHLPETWPFLVLLLLLIIGLARAKEKVSWIEILQVVSFAGLALYSSRMIPLFAIVAAPIATKIMSKWLREDSATDRWSIIESNIAKINSSSNGAIWLLVTGVAVTVVFFARDSLDSERRGDRFEESFFPVKAVQWLRQNPQNGNMFNEFDWGGYLLLELWPSYQIFMDGHTHIYGEDLTREYEKVITMGNGWQDVLTEYEVGWAIIRSDEPLAEALHGDLRWEIVYRDQTAIILTRK